MKTKSALPASSLARRTFIKWSLSAAAVPLISAKSWAQDYPTRVVTLVVFAPPGTMPDIIARLIGEQLSQRLLQPVIIENRPGAGGNLALQAVARAPADGHTLLLAGSPHAVAMSLYPNSPTNVMRDITPVASLNRDTFVLLVAPSFSAKSTTEFVAYAKANPGKINLASNGTGNLPHLAGELLRMAAGIEIQHIPYRGTQAAVAALMAGDVHALIDTVGATLSLVQSGNFRAIGVTSAERLPILPNVPTIAETLQGYSVSGWLGIGAPKGTPGETVMRLNREVNAVLDAPKIRARMAELVSDPFVSTPEDFGKLIAAEAEKWAKVVKTAGLKIE